MGDVRDSDAVSRAVAVQVEKLRGAARADGEAA